MSVIQSPPVTLIKPPLKIDIIPRVTTIEGIPAYATIIPTREFTAIPTKMGAVHATQIG